MRYLEGVLKVSARCMEVLIFISNLTEFKIEFGFWQLKVQLIKACSELSQTCLFPTISMDWKYQVGQYLR